MVVALVANHVQNGFFIFRSGEGYEYVLMIALVSGAVGALGAGGWSVDHVAGFTVPGWAGLAIAALAGAGGAALLLATSWRPGPAASQAPAASAASVPSSTPAPCRSRSLSRTNMGSRTGTTSQRRPLQLAQSGASLPKYSAPADV